MGKKEITIYCEPTICPFCRATWFITERFLNEPVRKYCNKCFARFTEQKDKTWVARQK